ncbi:hypothetical protein [Marmoricola sp. URHB0036]|jgi:hypothetical protein|uniref:hypothetical protein n=1 Tax=Marmoricola sp. URHB0036 TaxID=1298863 RepID=UPI00041A88BE|nr:hypothetical protein [Marmoricola sp. URHB0036]
MMASTTSPRSTAFIDGYQVRAGLRIPWDSNHERLSFSFFTVCDEATPPMWHGEVVLAGQVLHRTGSFDSHHLAGRAAERALVERLVTLFSW